MTITRFENKTKVADITPNTDEILNKVADITPNIDEILNAIYPIGVIVCGAKPTVGTWKKVEGRFLLGSSSSHGVGSTGGEETHTLTTDEMPSHSHNLNHPYAVWGPKSTKNGFTTSGGNWTGSDVAGGNYKYTANAGGGHAHNNMPPYLSVDMWRRTA